MISIFVCAYDSDRTSEVEGKENPGLFSREGKGKEKGKEQQGFFWFDYIHGRKGLAIVRHEQTSTCAL